jgi:hypothetical protein
MNAQIKEVWPHLLVQKDLEFAVFVSNTTNITIFHIQGDVFVVSE